MMLLLMMMMIAASSPGFELHLFSLSPPTSTYTSYQKLR
jgi:hypothetical protein